MRKQVIERSALAVAHQVRTVEDRIDQTLTDLAELQSLMMAARQAAGVGVTTGHDALRHVAEALSTLVEARGAIGAAHGALLTAKNEVPGLRQTMFGDLGECPPQKGSIDPGLRLVG